MILRPVLLSDTEVKRGKWTLTSLIHGSPEKKIELPGKGPYSLYLHDGKVCVGTADSDEGMFCTDYFQTDDEKVKKRELEAASRPDPKKAKTGEAQATRATTLKGMQATPGQQGVLISICFVVSVLS